MAWRGRREKEGEGGKSRKWKNEATQKGKKIEVGGIGGMVRMVRRWKRAAVWGRKDGRTERRKGKGAGNVDD